MDGNELTTRRQSSVAEEDLPQIQFDMMKKYTKDWKIRDILQALQKDIQFMDSGEYSPKNFKEDWNSDPIRRILSRVSSELMTRSPSEDDSVTSMAKEIKELEQSYRNVMEMFLSKTEKFLHSIKELRAELKKTAKQFGRISHFTAQVTLASSVTDIVSLSYNALHDALNFGWNPKIYYLPSVIGSLSIIASLIALSYMKQSTAEISSDVRDENRSFMDLIIVHRRGNWIDEEVLRLFPHGINLNFLNDDEEENSRNTAFDEGKMSWRLYLCSVIILTNIQKDAKLLKDEMFLTRVKVFVESQAAEIWWQRLKIKKLFDAMTEKMNNISVKKFVVGYEVHYSRTALYLCTVLIPLLVNSTGIRLFFSSIGGILAFSDLAGNKTENFEELKRISQTFEKDFKDIRTICNTLDNDYD